MTIERNKQFQILVLARRGESLDRISNITEIPVADIEIFLAEGGWSEECAKHRTRRKIIDILRSNGKTIQEIHQNTKIDIHFITEAFRLPLEETKSGNMTAYSKKEIDTIVKMKNEGKSDIEVGKAVGRTAGAISVKASQLRKEGILKKDYLTTKIPNQIITTGFIASIPRQVQIYKLWSVGKSKSFIANDLGCSLTDLEKIWSDVPGIAKAQDIFKTNVMELYSEGDNFTDIVEKLDADKERVQAILREIAPKEFAPVAITTPVASRMWSDEDAKLLVTMYREQNKSVTDLAKYFGRSTQAIYDKLSHMRVKRGESSEPVIEVTFKPWSNKDVQILRQGFEENYKPSEIAQKLGRTTFAVQKKMSILGLVRSKVGLKKAQQSYIKMIKEESSEPISSPVVEVSPVVDAIMPTPISAPITVYVNDKAGFPAFFESLAKINREIVIHL
jgi:hypothetical protein